MQTSIHALGTIFIGPDKVLCRPFQRPQLGVSKFQSPSAYHLFYETRLFGISAIQLEIGPDLGGGI